MNQTQFRFGLSGSTLKIIAIISMLIDHAGATVIKTILARHEVFSSPELTQIWNHIYTLSRDIGRIAFPIFCFLIVEGFIHTRNVKKYALRLFLFSLISEFAFDISLRKSFFFPGSQNVYITLLLGLLAIWAIRFLTEENHYHWIMAAPPVALMMYLAELMHTDYSYKGVFLISILYLVRRERLEQCLVGAASICWELPAPIAFIPIYLYNGKRGLRMKYFFYIFYPAHLIILRIICLIIQ